MSQIAEAYVRIRPDAANFGRELQAQAGPGIRRFENQLKSSNRELSRFSRGALVGTGALHGLGRAAAFASTSFIGGAGLVYGLKSTISAAMEAEVAVGQTEKAVQNAGLSWAQFGDQIQASALALSEISGVDDERFLRTFSFMVRKTEDVSKAFRLNAIAADVARGANIELESAAKIVLRASTGQARGLAQIGIEARKGASGVELLAQINEKYAGSAAKFADTAAGAQARFQVAINETQEAIGTALLPVLTKYLDKGTEWLNNTENQEKIQRITTTAVDATATSIDVLAQAIGKLNDLYGDYNALTEKSAGGKGGFFETLFSGTVVRQAESFAQAGRDAWAAWSKPLFYQGTVAGLVQQLALPTFPGQQSLIDRLTGVTPETAAAVAGSPIDPFADAIARHPGQRDSTRNERTATELARAQAAGIRGQIEAAAKARQAFVDDTIRFANMLISEGRGDTAKLQNTLQAFYGEQESLKGIFSAFADADEQARQDAIDAANERAANWRTANHAIQEAFAAARRQGRLFHEQFSANVRQEAEEQNARLVRQSDLGLLLLQNRVEAAGLAGGAKAQRAAEISAQRDLIGGLEDRVKFLRRMHAGQLEIVRAAGDVISAKIRLRDILSRDPDAKKARAGAGFSPQQFFAEAASEFMQYGSNIGGPLSPQNAGGDAIGIGVKKTHQTVVVQNFYAPVPSSQAMIDARNSAKNLK